jgi:uncharacterized protein
MSFILISVLIILLIDSLFHHCIRFISKKKSKAQIQAWLIFHWAISALIVVSLFIGFFIRPQNISIRFVSRYYFAVGIILTLYLPKLLILLFQLLADLFGLFCFILNKLSKIRRLIMNQRFELFRSYLMKVAWLIGLLVFCSVIYGMAYGRFNFQVEKVELKSAVLPEKFDKIRIVQISDIHIGSWYRHKRQLLRAIEQINSLKPDYIFFTGDMLTVTAKDMDGWYSLISKLEAKRGKYAVLGNHDYGDYYQWQNNTDKEENFRQVVKLFDSIGFRLMRNENTKLVIDGQYITLVGVDNWGHKPHPRYGDLHKAIANIDTNSFSILLSHDPSLWDEEIEGKQNIALTLSGHTHGMQMGIRFKNWKWSPAAIAYKHWAGLYSNKKQYLYVNRGLGYVGYPGRFGIRPEITLIELSR